MPRGAGGSLWKSMKRIISLASVQCMEGDLILWFVVLWFCGFVVFESNGFPIIWFSEFLVFWFSGFLVFWFPGCLVF